jgi:exodeoxyribonuclease V beta subunit
MGNLTLFAYSKKRTGGEKMNSLNPLTLPLKGTHLIEASAGTGKTYTIAALYVRLILGHEIDNALTPQNILVVTFTDAATEELRDRIRKRLSESAQYFRQQQQTEDDFLIQLRKSYDEKAWNRCAKRLEVAANYMDESAVFTIHSWCNKMLQQHAFDSGSPFKQDVNTDDTELLNNVIRDYWRIHFYGLEKNQCEWIVKNLAKSPDDFAEKIKGLLKETEALKSVDFPQDFPDSLDKIAITLHAIKWIRHRYAEEKKKLSRVTFDDMLNNLDNALQGKNATRLSEIIRHQYPVALIDEFQDTDPVQYRIFSTIYQNQLSSVSCFLIGDPKQAIYSFRGADIYTYLKAHQTTKNHHTLDTNFRSTQALIEAINQLFSHAENTTQGAFRFGNKKNNALPFIKVKANGRKDKWTINNQNAAALTFWQWQSNVPISVTSYREKLAKITASEICALLKTPQTGFKSETDFKPLQLKDIAILVRNRNEAKLIRRELSNRQLKSVYLSEQDSIYDTDEAKDVLMWLKAIENPRDERKVRTALSTKTFDFSKEKLLALTSNETEWETHLEHFQSYQIRWQENGILPALRLLIHDYGLHLTLNDENESERKLTNVLHLAELLQQHSSKIEGEEALIRHFAEWIESKNNRSAKENIIRLESDANLIKIITIHKSKGLEYPLVFLPFVSDFKPIDGHAKYYRYHDENNVCIDLEKKANSKELNDEERLQEDLRLLYVAVTRAQYACWLGVAPIKRSNTKTPQLEKTAIGHLLNWQPKTPADQLTTHLERVKGECESIKISTLPKITSDKFISLHQTNSTGSVKTSTVSISENWWTASYSALKVDYKKQRGVEIAEIETAQDDAQREDEETEFSLVESLDNFAVYALPKGAKPGVLIHALLEKCGDYGFAQANNNSEWQIKTIAEIFSDNLWDDEKRNVIFNALPKWLEMTLISNVKLTNLEKSQYKSELEFLIGAESVNVETLDKLITHETLNNEKRPALEKNHINGFLKGFIDLVFCHEGKYYVVDFKFNYLGNSAENYNHEFIKETMLKKRYDLQYAVYLLALHRLLKLRLQESYDYDKHIGGAIYVFLRGNAQIFDKPSRQFIENLDALFSYN